MHGGKRKLASLSLSAISISIRYLARRQIKDDSIKVIIYSLYCSSVSW
jgi:hypothetical protein